MKKLLLISVVLALIAGLILSGCTSTPSSPATPPASSAPTANVPSGTAPGTPSGLPPGSPSVPPPSQSAPAETVNVGLVAWFGSSSGLDWMHGVEALVANDNKNGGLDIGGKRYQVKLIEYDSNNAQATEVSAINRLMYEDKVKYIIAFTSYQDAWINTTDQNKVLVLSTASDINLALRPNLHYSFNGACNNPGFVAFTGWFCKNNPDATKKVVRAFPDSQMGHFLAMAIGGSFQIFGVTPTDEYYPASQQDLSSLGTKVVSLGATAFMGVAGGTAGDALIYNAVLQAGFKGQFFTTTQPSTASLKTVLSPEALEGFVCGAYATEFDPPATQNAKDFKDSWIAKYGKWEYPDVAGTSSYFCLRAALQQAGSLDVDKVVNVLANGMKYETINGPAQMVSRPDLGNSRTIDSVSTAYINKIHNGQAALASTINIEDVISYMRTAFPPLAPGATPAGPPPGPPPGP